MTSTVTARSNHFVPDKKELSLKERFVRYITDRDTAEVFNSALAAMNGGYYIPRQIIRPAP